MSFSARPTSSNQLTQLVSLAAHGFTVGQCLIYDGAWVLAQADSLLHCAGSWIVSIVPDVNSFYVTQEGWVNNLPAQTPGVQLYLSPGVAGTFTTVKPTTVGQVILPCLVCDTATTGYFYGGSGEVIETGTLFDWTLTAGGITMAVNNGYFMTAAGNMTLPTNYNKDDVLKICSHVGNGFTVIQTQAYHEIFDLGLASTLGATGTFSTVQNGASVELVAEANNGPWRVINNKGTFTCA